MKKLTGLHRAILVGAALFALAAPLFYPPLLAFPHRASLGEFEVWSEEPIDQRSLAAVLNQARALVAASPLYRQPEQRSIFLTRGGLRWYWLTNRSYGAFAITRPLSDDIVINRNSIAANAVLNGRAVGGRRSLSAIVAHEVCHGMLRRRYGLTVDWSRPVWLREGYCDHVAQETSLSAADVARLKSAGQSHPAIPYFEGRQKVGALLSENGGNVDELFAGSR